MKVAFLFPGQGSQRPNLLDRLSENRVVADTIAEANDVLGMDVFELTTESALKSTQAVQISLLVSEVATYKAFQSHKVQPHFVAGHSVGAFSAAVASKVISFSDALNVVSIRGKAMEDAHPRGYGMGVVLGLEEATLEEVILDIKTDSDPVYLANVNSPTQITISGSKQGIEQVLQKAVQKGATRTEILNVATPSHCPLQAEVAKTLKDALDQVPIHRPQIPYVSNKGGRILYNENAIRTDLIESITAPVRWHDATTVLFELGVRLFIEMPPGSVLTRLAAKAFPDVRSVAVSESGFNNCLFLANKYV